MTPRERLAPPRRVAAVMGDAVMGDTCCGEPARGEPAPPFGCSRLRVSSLPWERAAASPVEGEGRPDPPASSPRRLRPPSLPHRTVGGPRRLFSAPGCRAVRHAALLRDTGVVTRGHESDTASRRTRLSPQCWAQKELSSRFFFIAFFLFTKYFFYSFICKYLF